MSGFVKLYFKIKGIFGKLVLEKGICGCSIFAEMVLIADIYLVCQATLNINIKYKH